MTAVMPFIFEEQLVRSILRNDEPWFVGRDVCHVLDLRNESQAMARLDDDERAEVSITDPSGSKTAIAVSEPGVFRLIFTSRKPEAERFKRWLAHEVLPSLRRTGTYVAPGAMPNPFAVTAEAVPVLSAKLQMIREARHLWGHERARALWQSIGLPLPAAPATGGQHEARRCLWHLLHAPYGPDAAIFTAILEALDGDDDKAAALRRQGIVCNAESGGFIVINRHPAIAAVYQGSEWDCGQWPPVLRRLSGSATSQAMRFGKSVSRGVFIPETELDWRQRDMQGSV
jgi:prophage antirepressor-like protein